MEVLVVTRWFPDSRSPLSGVFNVRDCELIAEEHDVTVLHLGSSDPGVRLSDSLRVVRAPFGALDVRSGGRVRRLLKGMLEEADLLHTMAYPSLTAVIGLPVNIPWVHTEHASLLISEAPTRRSRMLASAPFRRLLRRPDEVVAVGQELASAVRRSGARSVSVIRNHVTLPDVTAALPEPIRPSAPIRLIATGGLVAGKGPVEALQAVALVRQRGLDVSLTWAGDGPLRDEAERVVKSLHLEDVVRFLGHVDTNQIPGLLREHQLFFLPTARETFGISIAEAVAQGLPVVTSGRGEHERFLPPGGSRLVEDRTPESLAVALDSLIRDNARLSPEELRAHAAREFDAGTRKAAYEKVYRNAAA